MSVKDVPFDQGGYVYVNFVRSGYDARGESNIITEYIIEMSNPPGENGFSWTQLGTVQPLQNPLYSFIAETPNDSITNNSGTYYFRVTARTSDQNQYWRSNIVYGHSVDNLAPAPVENFAGNLQSPGESPASEVNLSWSPNTEIDLSGYLLFRTDYPNADPDTLTPLATVIDTTYIDTSPLSGTSHYYIQAEDIHNNLSDPVSTQVDALLSANIKVYLQGPYSGSTMSTTLRDNDHIPLNQPYNTTPWNYSGSESVAIIPAGIVDWVLLELRSDLTTVVARRAAFLKSDGSLVDLDGSSFVDFPGVNEGNYYVVIYHRNHLEIMTATALALSSSSSEYDFSSAQTQAYRPNPSDEPMIDLGGGVFAIYSGDTNNSGIITAADKSAINLQNLSEGYYSADTNFSGIVTAADKTLVNSNNLREIFVP